MVILVGRRPPTGPCTQPPGAATESWRETVPPELGPLLWQGAQMERSLHAVQWREQCSGRQGVAGLHCRVHSGAVMSVRLRHLGDRSLVHIRFSAHTHTRTHARTHTHTACPADDLARTQHSGYIGKPNHVPFPWKNWPACCKWFFMWLDCLYPQQRLPGGEPFQRATVYSEFRSRGHHLELAHGTQWTEPIAKLLCEQPRIGVRRQSLQSI